MSKLLRFMLLSGVLLAVAGLASPATAQFAPGGRGPCFNVGTGTFPDCIPKAVIVDPSTGLAITSLGGGGGGTVPTTAPGTSASSAVPMQGVTGGIAVGVTDAAAVAALNTGNGSLASIATASARGWRGPATATATTVSVAAGASTQLIAANATRRGLILSPSNTSCFLNVAGGTASAGGLAIPGGWAFTETDPPPAGAVTAYCGSAASVSVTELN